MKEYKVFVLDVDIKMFEEFLMTKKIQYNTDDDEQPDWSGGHYGGD